MRDDRAALVRVQAPFHGSWDKERGTEEYELPYTPEAWAGILRIDHTLREMQRMLAQFAEKATPVTLAQLGSGDVSKLLPAAVSAPAKPARRAR
jgi:hypothetical protein